MKSLSQSDFANFRNLYESVYAPRFETILDEFTDEEVDELTEEIIEEVVEEFFLECLEEGFDIESVEETLCESLDTSLMMLNEVSDSYYAGAVKSGKAKAAKAKRAEMIGKVKKAVSKVGSALKAGAGKAAGAAKAGAKAAYKGANRAAGYAAGAAGRAASTAKSEFKKGYERGSKGSSSSSSDSGSSDSGSSSSSSDSGSSSSGSTRRAVGGAARKVGSLLKRGLKKAIGGAARAVEKGAGKVARRMGEELEVVNEADSLAAMQARREKRLAAQRKREGTTVTGRDLGHDYSLTPAQQKARRDAEYKAGTRKEEVEEVDEAMSSYDRNRKRAAQRAAARNAARDAGKTGVVPGVGYVTPRRERETYVDSAGTTRHKSGARMEELEATGLFSEKEIEAIMKAEMIDENRRAARAAGGYKDDSKKQPDPSKDGFTGVGNMSIDAIRKMSARIEKKK